MARNILIQFFRGLKAAMPNLGLAEPGFATDEVQLYVGTASGNKLALLSSVVVPPQVFGTAMAPTSAPGGPSNPRRVVAFAKLTVNGTVYFVPLMQ